MDTVEAVFLVFLACACCTAVGMIVGIVLATPAADGDNPDDRATT